MTNESTKLMILGDTHGEWGPLNSLINKKQPDIIFQCGDFGFWPGMGLNHWPSRLNLHGGKLYWTPGNHEQWWALNQLEEKYGKVPIEVEKDIFYMPRGTTLTLIDGTEVLFMGGAESIDKAWRTVGIDWFPDETITQKDIYDLPDKRIDVVISHTCPIEFEMINEFKDKDPSRYALSAILHKYKPKLWFFGHWHYNKKGHTNGCYWEAMNMTHGTGWWKCIVISQTGISMK